MELSEPIQAAVITLRKLEKQASEALAGLKDGEEGVGKGSRADQVLHHFTLLQLFITVGSQGDHLRSQLLQTLVPPNFCPSIASRNFIALRNDQLECFSR